MDLRKLYIIAGCNGAGKTTASYTILPEILDCQEYVNADEIARGLSPFRPQQADIDAGRFMLSRIKKLLSERINFAFETTLASKSFVNLIKEAQNADYHVTMLFFWLYSEQLAIQRVRERVKEGGHDVSTDIINRRYNMGLKNFFQLYLPVVDNWLFIDNSGEDYSILAEGTKEDEIVHNQNMWEQIRNRYEQKR